MTVELDEEQQARKRYKKDLVHLKPDLAAYNRQKALAIGNGEGSSSALTSFNPQGGAVRTLGNLCYLLKLTCIH